MEKLKKLHLDKIINEFTYIKSDFTYKSELINNVDKQFIKDVNKLLESYPDLKKIYDDKITAKIENTIINENTDIEIFNEESSYIKEEFIVNADIKSDKIKKVYKSIAKLTHPDKVNNKKLNEIYLVATKYYDDNDIFSLYNICEKLGIDYSMEENETNFIETEILAIKNKISFLEETYTWKWYNSDGKSKDAILIAFIKTQLK